jgi:putative glutamine amidotransferase
MKLLFSLKFYRRHLTLLFVVILFISSSAAARNFFRSDYDTEQKIILLANPTIANLKTINYLVDNKILKINTKKIRFVGVYHITQQYDFSKTQKYIDEENLKNYHLHELNCHIDEESLFYENTCTDELKNIFDNSAGIFFFGGPDIPPSVYGEENTLSVVTDPGRHYFELTFLFHLLGGSQNRSFKPFLEEDPDYFATGFCLGLQTFNVATGGSLIQDIPSEIYNTTDDESIVKLDQQYLHRNYWQNVSDDSLLMGINIHTINFTASPFFGKRVKVTKNLQPNIYSSHHQAIDTLGEGFEVTALSSDKKVIEGIAHKRYPQVFAVQFHPEVPALYEDMEEWKFKPGDKPKSYHQLIGSDGLSFHKRYWKYVSKAIKKSLK